MLRGCLPSHPEGSSTLTRNTNPYSTLWKLRYPTLRFTKGYLPGTTSRTFRKAKITWYLLSPLTIETWAFYSWHRICTRQGDTQGPFPSTVLTWFCSVTIAIKDRSYILPLRSCRVKPHFLKQCYDKATAIRHGYLLISLSSFSEKQYQLRTNIFPGEDTVVFTPSV